MYPVIDIIAPDGTRYRAGKKYALGYDGANAEAKELYGLTEWKLETVEWVKSNAGLSGCGYWNTYAD